MKNNIPYISIKSVLYDLSTMIDPLYWNEDYMHEWAIKGYRKMGIRPALQEDVCIIEIIDHKGRLPSDLRFINQIVYRADVTEEDLDFIRRSLNLEETTNGTAPENPALIHMDNPDGVPMQVLATALGRGRAWLPMTSSTNSFMKTALMSDLTFQVPVVDNWFESNNIHVINGSNQEYMVDPSLCITTTIRNGLIMVSYLKYAVDDCGDTLIPNDENLKDALFHYCMYRYWMSKSLTKEESSERLRDYHLQMYEVLKIKTVGKMNMPDTNEMENLRRIQTRLLPSSNDWSTYFATLNGLQTPNF